MSHDDFDFEPIRGLPAALPSGERLLWQGSPDWKSLAIHAYHIRKVAGYFLALIAWRVAYGLNEGHLASAVLQSCAILLTLGCLAAGVLALLAYLSARSAVYSITSGRVLFRHGVAVPLTMNVPFGLIDNAALRHFADGTGDISIVIAKKERIGYLIAWPHVRSGQFAHPQPSFRCLSDANGAAEILGAALAAAAGCEPHRRENRSLVPSSSGFTSLGNTSRAAGPNPAAAV